MESIIRNKEEQKLFMNFYNLRQEDGSRPSDIDMFYMTKDEKLIIGEIKQKKGEYKGNQRYIHEKFIDNYSKPAYILYIKHDKDVHKGDEEVDVSTAIVEEYYYNGRWHTMNKGVTVKEVFEKLTKGTEDENTKDK